MIYVIPIFFFNSVISQDNSSLSDSALNVLETQSLTQEEKLNTLYFAGSYSSIPEIKLSCANAMLDIIESGNYGYIFKIRAFTLLGGGFKLEGNLSESLKSFLKSAEISALNSDIISEADAYVNVARLYTSTSEYNKSLKHYQKAIQLYASKADSMRMSVTYINYSYAAYKANELDSAIKFSNQAIDYSQNSRSSPYVKAYAQSNLALAMSKSGDYQSAKPILNSAIETLENNGDNYAISDCLTELGGILLEQHQINDAIINLDKAYRIAKSNGLKEQVKNASKHLSEAYKALGNMELAYEYQNKFYTYRDSLVNAEKIRELADLRTEFEVGQKQAELDLVSAQKKAQEIILYAVVGGALLLLALIIVIYRNSLEKNRINKILAEQKTQLEELNHTKDKLFSIISHDLRSPVHAFAGIGQLIKFAVEDKSYDELLEISEHVEKTSNDLSDLLDGLLKWALQQQGNFKYEPEQVNCNELSEEVNRLFLNAAKSKNISISNTIDKDLAIWADRNITHTILRNLVNNALIFTEDGGQVHLSAAEEGEFVKIQITDTGIGIPDDKLHTLFKAEGSKASFGTAGEKGLGLGLQLVYEFVSMNDGKVEVESEEGKGTTFTVILPKYSTQG